MGPGVGGGIGDLGAFSHQSRETFQTPKPKTNLPCQLEPLGLLSPRRSGRGPKPTAEKNPRNLIRFAPA